VDVFCSKLLIGMEARRRWPMYATHEEDLLLRKSKWVELNDYRVVMHDNTNVGMATASDTDRQRSLYSEYYTECCAKGGTYLQLCGWIRSSNMVTGHSSDDKSMELMRILESQQKFQKHDKKNENDKIKPLLNTLDKGFRIAALARKYDQNVLQPIFAKSDEEFPTNHLLQCAHVAVIRSGKERGVRYMKHSWIVAKGIVGISI